MVYSDDVMALNKDNLKELGLNLLQGGKPSKYHNARAEYKGMTFQSGHEMDVVGKLVMAEENHAGVHGLRLQVDFALPGGIIYRADATYGDDDLQFHVVDAKAWDVKTQKFLRTPEFKLKAKLFKATYGQDIEEL